MERQFIRGTKPSCETLDRRKPVEARFFCNGMTFSFCSPIGMPGLNLGLPTAWVVKCKKCGCTINCRAIDPQVEHSEPTKLSPRLKTLSS